MKTLFALSVLGFALSAQAQIPFQGDPRDPANLSHFTTGKAVTDLAREHQHRQSVKESVAGKSEEELYNQALRGIGRCKIIERRRGNTLRVTIVAPGFEVLKILKDVTDADLTAEGRKSVNSQKWREFYDNAINRGLRDQLDRNC